MKPAKKKQAVKKSANKGTPKNIVLNAKDRFILIKVDKEISTLQVNNVSLFELIQAKQQIDEAVSKHLGGN